jgi:hypothetical protein
VVAQRARFEIRLHPALLPQHAEWIGLDEHQLLHLPVEKKRRRLPLTEL